jgi:hypothetical protein
MGGLLLVAAAAMAVTIWIGGRPPESVVAANGFCLAHVGVTTPDWETVIITASRVAGIPRDRVWGFWSKIQDWPTWSGGAVESAHWTRGSPWEDGAEFEQVLHLPPPIGRHTSHEVVHVVKRDESVAWWNVSLGVRYCHVWTFEPVSPTETRVTNTDVFHGMLAGLLKTIFAAAWQRWFASSVDGLIQAASGGH